MTKRNSLAQKGFTLIELLIVIVIIGILAGVLIAVIDPVAQQNKAKDANVKATMQKIALSTKGHYSAYGNVPDGASFIEALQNAAIVAGCTTGDFCEFSVTGVALGATCGAANGYNGSGTGQCIFRYERQAPAAGDSFKIVAKAWGTSQTFVYWFDSANGTDRLYICPASEDSTPGAQPSVSCTYEL